MIDSINSNKVIFLKCIIFFILFLSSAISDEPDIFINEFLSSNASSNLDPDFFSFCDWIEIFNSEDSTVNMSGYYLTDDLSDPFKFQFPDNTNIEPNGYFIVWADGKDYSPGGYHIYPQDINITVNACHANFKLKKSGEEIALFSQNGNLIDLVTYDEQVTNVSNGRFPDGASDWFYFDEPTPYNPNFSSPYADTTRSLPPQISPSGGYYDISQPIEILSDETLGTIRFTLDGSTPNSYSQIYTEPIIIDSTTVLRAKVFDQGFLSSEVKTESYFINDNFTLPVIAKIKFEIILKCFFSK